mmetsp:Transcript_17391/g.36462  ORF Transcript_17391/g.36462 Transcript_17391/m.36462 type:complete len:210 (+) Transcript_17391:789-1418(+)
MLYLRNVNQVWHRAMVRYLEDAYTTGTDIYPMSLLDVYQFLNNWKTCHRVRGGFSRKGDGIKLATAEEGEENRKHYPRFVMPGKEHILCWDCGHRHHNKVCPNYNLSKQGNSRGDKNDKKEAQVNTTTGDDSGQGATGGGGSQVLFASSLTDRNVWTVLATTAAKDESVLCTLAKPQVAHNFIFFQKTAPATDTVYSIGKSAHMSCLQR